MVSGKLFARLAHINGRTRLIEHRQSAPLKIARTFEREYGGMEICIMDASPGLLAGDHYEMEWVLEPGSRARITTQGATRVHPSTGPLSRQTVKMRVAEGARLEWWPEATIPFQNARFESSIEAELSGDAQLILFESLSAGRIARGEVFGFDSVFTQVHVYDEAGPRLCTRNRFCPTTLDPRGNFAWGGATQLSSLYAFGVEPRLQELQWALDTLRLRGGVSTLARGDMAVMMLGHRAHDLRCAALEIERLFHVKHND